MLVNLKRALDAKGISMNAYAGVLGVTQKTLWNKINEETPFTYPEAVKTTKELFPEYKIEYLFAPDGKQ